MDEAGVRQRIGTVALVVPDYDEAIAFYAGVLGFDLVEDTQLDTNKRWVLVAPPGGRGYRLLLARAATERQRAAIGNQTGGRIFLFLETDNLDRDHARMRESGVRFVREPSQERYGKVAVFEDPFGNAWDLIEPTHATPDEA
jgi:catechol 2,3-dioxygenase-like lactoylglutathione lyase family enzyme